MKPTWLALTMSCVGALAACRGVVGIEPLEYVAGDASGPPAEAGPGMDAGMEATTVVDTGAGLDQTSPPPGDGGMFGACVAQGPDCRMCCHAAYTGMPATAFSQDCLCTTGSACGSLCGGGGMCPPPPGADASACGMCFDDTAQDPSSASSACQQAVSNCRANPSSSGCAVVACLGACPQ